MGTILENLRESGIQNGMRAERLKSISGVPVSVAVCGKLPYRSVNCGRALEIEDVPHLPPSRVMLCRLRLPRRSATVVLLSLALLAAGALPVAAQSQAGGGSSSGGEQEGVGEGLLPDSLGPDGSTDPDPDAGSSAAEVAFPNLGSQLSALAVASAGGGPDAGVDGAATGPTLPDGTNSTLSGEPLLLTIQLGSNRDGVLEFLADNGVTPANAAGDYLEVYVPPELLGPLASQTGVSRVRQMPQPFKDRGTVTSGGVKAHGAQIWHFNGFTGDGVKVGVIDSPTNSTAKDGFTRLRALLGTDLPSTVAGRCYTDVGKPTSDLANCDTAGGDTHGTRVAESLMDMAPDAALYISNPSSWADLHSAVVWMHGEGVKVINYSSSWSFHGAADGTSPVSPSPLNTAKWAADNGITWVNSAGNYGQKAWYGAFADSDNDGYHEWAGTGSSADEAQMFELGASDSVFVNMRWDDVWGGATKDLDLEVRYSATRGGAQTVVGSSADVQSGGTTDYPLEGMYLPVSNAGFYWVYAKKKAASAAPSWVQFMVFGPVGQIDHHTSATSVTSPGDSSSPGVLAVGAAGQRSWLDPTYYVKAYSGRGPTPDGRTKPDIVAEDCEVTTFGGFCGTSQAAPHVAGLAALVLERNPTFTPQQVADYLKAGATDHGAAGADNNWGHGLALLPTDGLTTLDEHCATTALAGSGTVQGTWKTCPSEAYEEALARYYSFALDQQSDVTIELTTTSQFTTRLDLRRGGDKRSGSRLNRKQITGSAGTPARMEINLPVGDYTIEARPFHAFDSGSFTLDVQGVPTLVESGSEISIAAGGDVTEGGDAVFALSANPAPSAPLTVWVKVAPQGAFGVTWGLHPVTVSTSGSGSLTVPTVDDGADEADGSVTATVDASPRYAVSSSAGSATVTVADDEDPLPQPVTGDDCVAALTGDGAFAAEWTDACGSVDRSGAQARFFTFSLDSPSTVTIDLSAPGTANQLYLRDGWGRKAGPSIAPAPDNCDRSNGYADCPYIRARQIRKYLPAGYYTIEATPTYSDGTGPFTLAATGLPTQAEVGQLPPLVSITAGGDVTEGGDATFTLSASPVPASPLAVDVSVSSFGDFGVATGARRVTIPTSGSVAFTVTTSDDSTDEENGSVTVTVDNGTGYLVRGLGSASVAIADDEDTSPPADACVRALLSEGNVDGEWAPGCDSTVRDGRHARFYTFSLDSQASVTIDLTSSVDAYLYLRRGLGQKAGAEVERDDDGGEGRNSHITRTLAVGDYTIEATTYGSSKSGKFRLTVAGLPGPTVVEPEPVVSIAPDSDITEGGDATFTISASPAPASALDVTVTVAQNGDFGVTPGSQTVTVSTGGTGTLTVATSDDSTDEADGSVTATVTDGTDYDVSATAGSATVAVADDDVPEVSIAPDSDITEGGDTTFTLTASPTPHAALSVSVAVAQTGDFGVTPGSPTVTIPTTGSATLTVTTIDDGTDEPDGSVTATVTDGTDYTVSATAGTATVAVADDDDPPPPPPCTPNLPSDAVTVSEVTGWRDGHSGAAHVLRWNRVLAALGVDTGETPMTVAESRANEGQFMASRWARVTRTLEALEQCDDPPPPPPVPEVSVASDGDMTEGGDATFTISASPAPAAALDVAVAVTQTGDFGVAVGSRTVSIPTSGSATLTVATSDDSTDEADGSVTATVADGTDYDVSATAGSATVAVADDDDPPPPPPCTPNLPSDAVTVSEVTGWRDGHSGAAHVLRWNRVLAALGVDTGETPMTVAESRTNEGQFMQSRWDRVTRTLEALEQCDDLPPPPPPVPEVSIASDGDITEGGDATFALTASPAPTSALTVAVSVTQSGDFGVTAGSRTVTIATSGSATLTVATSDDSTDEADGSVTATVADGADYDVSTTAGAATVAVADDDVVVVPPPPPPPATPVVSIASDGDITEGGDATFTLTADPAPAAALAVTVSVTQSGDFGAAPGSRTVTISTGGTGTMTVPTTGDTTDEADGSVTATVTDGTDYDVSATAGAATVAVADDDVPEITLTADGDIAEGGDATFTLTADPTPAAPLTVDVTVTQTGDYGAATGARQVTIPATGTATLTVATTDDSTDEPDGSVTVAVDDGSGYSVSTTAHTAAVAVSDDDDPPTDRLPPSQVSFTAEDASATEGETLRFRVMLSNAATKKVRVWWTTRYGGDGDRAFPGRDYNKTRGWLTFNPGDTQQWVQIPLPDDPTDEPDEVFNVYLGFTEGGATIADRDATMTIIDND